MPFFPRDHRYDLQDLPPQQDPAGASSMRSFMLLQGVCSVCQLKLPNLQAGHPGICPGLLHLNFCHPASCINTVSDGLKGLLDSCSSTVIQV
jgi:hypothetical protein